MPNLHQFTAGYALHDAISNEANVFQQVFRQWGYNSEIYSLPQNTSPERRTLIRDANLAPAQIAPEDVVLLHLSIGSEVNDIFASLKCRKAILYHNITPSHFFDFVNPTTALHLKKGREQAKTLSSTATINLADSQYNALELQEWGYQNVGVLPIVVDRQLMACPPDTRTLTKYRDGLTNIIFVGRCSPNKKIEDLVTTFSHYQKKINPNSRFIHIGSTAGTERYHAMLLTQVKAHQLRNFYFIGSVTQPTLNACYNVAHAFLCMSEHEGFCIPLIESFAHGVPVVARAAAAVPETMDHAGILLDTPDPSIAAEALHRVISDTDLRSAVIRGQQERLARYDARDLPAELNAALAPLLKS